MVGNSQRSQCYILTFSTALLTEEAARKAVPPFTKIHGHPSCGDHNTLKDEVLQALGAVDVPDSNNGLISELAKPANFKRITGEDEDYDVLDKPLPYDDSIDCNIMSPDKVKMVEAEHIQRLTSWHVRKRTLLGVGDQFRKALDKRFYKRLEKKVIGYKNVTVTQYFDYLDNKQCLLETHVVRELKAHALRGRLEEDKDLGKYSKILKDDTACLKEGGIKISDVNMPQHSMEQTLESGLFDENQEYDQQDPDDKDWGNTDDHWESVLGPRRHRAFQSRRGWNSKKSEV